MKKMLIAMSLMLLTACSSDDSSSGKASSKSSEPLVITDAYVREMPPGQMMTAAFMQITYNGPIEDFSILGVKSSVADTVEIHDTQIEGGTLRMRPVEALHLPRGETVILQPGSLHIMLMAVKQPLKPGEQIPIVLYFSDGSEYTVQVPVRDSR